MNRLAAALMSSMGVMMGATYLNVMEIEESGTLRHLNFAAGFDRVNMKADALRIDSGDEIEFGHDLSHIQGDSSSVWVSTRDGTSSTVGRMGMIADHDGISGIGVFDAANSPKNQPDGPSANDTLQGIAHFYMKYGPPYEFWVRYEDDNGVEREALLGVLNEY